MARGKRKEPGRRGAEQNAADGTSGKPGLPVREIGTSFVITDIVLRAAGGLIKDQMEKAMLAKSYGSTHTGRIKAKKLVEGRGVISGVALWGASRIARRSPLGLAVVAGGLAAKVFYDRGKRLDAERAPNPPRPVLPDTES